MCFVPGAPVGCPPGNPEDWLSTEFTDLGVGPLVKVTPHGVSQHYALVVDGVQFPAVYIPEDVTAELTGVWSQDESDHCWTVSEMGPWQSNSIDVTGQQLLFMASRSARIRGLITPGKVTQAYGTGSGQVSAVALAGVERFSNCDPYPLRPQWGRLALEITTIGGAHQVNLYCKQTIVCSGSIVGSGTVNLSAANNSGISGTLALAYSADVALSVGAFVSVQWPATIRIYRQAGSPIANTVGVAYDTITDDGYSSSFTYRSPTLANATWYILCRQFSDTGKESSNTENKTAIIAVPPKSPTSVAYLSGTSTATIISWTDSTSSGSPSYHCYDSADGSTINMSAIAATQAAGVGQLTLPAISGAFTGIRQVILRATSGGVEEGNSTTLKIEYLAGARVPPRPAAPGISSRATTSGRGLTLTTYVDQMQGDADAAHVDLWLSASPTIDFTSTPDGTAAVVQNTRGRPIDTVSVSATSSGNGLYYYAVRTRAANGTHSSNSDVHGPIVLSLDASPAPEFAEFFPGA